MIRLQNIHKTYQSATPLHVLKGIDLNIEAGELVSIMGASGSGKSTLLNILGILDDYDEGTYTLDGTLIRGLSETRAAELRNQMIGFVFQSFNLIAHLPVFVGDSFHFTGKRFQRLHCFINIHFNLFDRYLC